MAQKARRRVSPSRSTVGRATRGVTFDTGVLIALERRQASALALLRACRMSRATITIPAAVVAEWWRGSHRAHLEIGSLESLSPELAQRAGELLAVTKGSNAVDATVVASPPSAVTSWSRAIAPISGGWPAACATSRSKRWAESLFQFGVVLRRGSAVVCCGERLAGTRISPKLVARDEAPARHASRAEPPPEIEGD